MQDNAAIVTASHASARFQAGSGGVPAAVGGGNVRNHGHLGNDGVFIWDDGWGNRIIEREVVHEVVREVPAPPPEPCMPCHSSPRASDGWRS